MTTRTDIVVLSSAPWNEECVQVGDDNYAELSRAECRRFIALIRERCGEEPEGAHLYVKANCHDFGTYYEVACRYDVDNQKAEDYAWSLFTSKALATW